MSKDMRRLIVDFQIWFMLHVNQLYLWLMITSALSGGIYFYSIYHHISLTTNLIIILFMYIVTWKIIIR